MREYEDCYIAFIDLLGFKELVKKEKCETIASYFDKITEEYIIENQNSGSVLVDFDSIIKRKIMSDTICLYVDASKKNSLASIVAACSYFQVKMLRMSEPVLTRGSIVRGNIFNNEDVTFGEGVSEAYLLEENVAKNPRIIIKKAVIDNSDNDKEGKEYIETYVYDDGDGFYTLDYLLLFCGLDKAGNMWNKFSNYVRKTIDSCTDTSILKKYLYIEKSIERAKIRYDKYFSMKLAETRN